jgi:hypothetical protein
MTDELKPIAKPEIMKLMRIAVGLHVHSLPQMKGRGASKDRRQIEGAVDRFADKVATTFLSGKVVMQLPRAPVLDEKGAPVVGGALRIPGEVIYKMSALLAIQHERGFAIVELLQDVDTVAVGDGVEGTWSAGGEQPLYHQGRRLDAYYHDTCFSREDAIRAVHA